METISDRQDQEVVTRFSKENGWTMRAMPTADYWREKCRVQGEQGDRDTIAIFGSDDCKHIAVVLKGAFIGGYYQTPVYVFDVAAHTREEKEWVVAVAGIEKARDLDYFLNTLPEVSERFETKRAFNARAVRSDGYLYEHGKMVNYLSEYWLSPEDVMMQYAKFLEHRAYMERSFESAEKNYRRMIPLALAQFDSERKKSGEAL